MKIKKYVMFVLLHYGYYYASEDNVLCLQSEAKTREECIDSWMRKKLKKIQNGKQFEKIKDSKECIGSSLKIGLIPCDNNVQSEQCKQHGFFKTKYIASEEEEKKDLGYYKLKIKTLSEHAGGLLKACSLNKVEASEDKHSEKSICLSLVLREYGRIVESIKSLPCEYNELYDLDVPGSSYEGKRENLLLYCKKQMIGFEEQYESLQHSC